MLSGLPLQTARLQQEEALPDKKSLRNEGCFLEKGAWVCAHTRGMVRPWTKRKEPADLTSPQTKPRELFLGNLPSALGVAWPAPEVWHGKGSEEGLVGRSEEFLRSLGGR